MKINITRDENGRIIGIDALSESSDGHLSSEEKQILTDVLNNDHEESLKKIEEDSKTEQKKIEEGSKVSLGKHKEWAGASTTIITGFCKAVVDYLEEREIKEATKPKEQEFDTSVDHLDLTGPKNEESNEATVDDYKGCINDVLDHMNIGRSKPQIEDHDMSLRRDKFAS